ncbi:hypothetical protein APHAL10511_002832 [Amanita phalloides]|nr:hypothetical protein APHAL10511_002832 [Amanita phalloides]
MNCNSSFLWTLEVVVQKQFVDRLPLLRPISTSVNCPYISVFGRFFHVNGKSTIIDDLARQLVKVSSEMSMPLGSRGIRSPTRHHFSLSLATSPTLSCPSMFALVAGLGVLWACRVRAYQTAVCTVSEDSWMYNSLGQSPCRVAEFLSYPCRAFTVTPLNTSQWYGPAVDNACGCNTVMYNMLAACAICQGASQQGWKAYSQNCTHEYVGTYPEGILSVTAVPHWAYIDISGTNLFDANQAASAGDAPETTEAVGTTVTTTATVSATATPTHESRPSKTTSIIGPVIGGVIGGLALIALVAGGIFYWVNQRREPQIQMQPRPNILGTPALSPVSADVFNGATYSPNHRYEMYEPQMQQNKPVSIFSCLSAVPACQGSFCVAFSKIVSDKRGQWGFCYHCINTRGYIKGNFLLTYLPPRECVWKL